MVQESSSVRRETWRVIRSHELLWRSWDSDEFVVYHTGSGETHLLNAAAAEVLRLLGSAELTRDELIGLSAASYEVEPDDQLRANIDKILGDFDELGLIEPAS